MNTNKTKRLKKMPNPKLIPTKKNIIVATFKSLYYMAENVIYYLFYKKWVDRKVKEYLDRRYKKDEVIVVALHGFCEYYWQSFTKYMEYFDRKGKVIIPVGFDYCEDDKIIVEILAKKLKEIHNRTKARIILIGDSTGAIINAKYLFKYKPDFVSENIPIAGLYEEYKKDRGIAFWARWFIKTPEKDIARFAEKLKKSKIPKTRIALYARYDAFVIPTSMRYLNTAENIGFYTGHFGMLYDPEVIEFVYKHIYE